jgi:hypothetical protein
MSNIGTKGELVRRESTARSTGGVVRILNLAHPEAHTLFTPELIAEAIEADTTWGTACEHDLIVLWATVREASAKAANPETWCPTCELRAEGRGYFTTDLA